MNSQVRYNYFRKHGRPVHASSWGVVAFVLLGGFDAWIIGYLIYSVGKMVHG